MKKSLLIAALAVFTMASCSKDEVVEVKSNEISFSVLANNSTKASEVYGSNNVMTEFHVWSGYTLDGTNWTPYFSNETATESATGVWSTAKTYYWPELGTGKALNFYAIAGFTEENSKAKVEIYKTDANVSQPDWVGGPQPRVVSFEPNADVAKQEDLLYAVYSQTTAADANTKAVMNFRHALSQIEFQAKNVSNNLCVTISDVTIGYLAKIGVFQMPAAATTDNWNWGTDNANDTENADNNYIDSRGKWEKLGSEGDAMTSYSVNVQKDGKDIVVDNLDKDAIVNLTVSSGYENVNNSMLLIPQTRDAWTPGAGETEFDGSYIAVKCKFYNKAVGTAAFDAEEDVLIKSCWAIIPVEIDWVPGKRYIYTLLFGNGDGGYEGTDPNEPTPGVDPVLLPIEYQVTVDDFDKIVEPDSVFETEEE